MALFKIFKGNESSYLTDVTNQNFRRPVEGYCYFVTDTNKFYVDKQTPDQNTVLTNANLNNYRVALNADFATKALFNSDGDDISSATNWINGSSAGSVRTSGSKEEDSNYVIGLYAVAEGCETKASANSSHAEGYNTTASGLYSHAEGYHTTASHYYSHAEGYYTVASGDCSHAEGYCTTAQRASQTVIGEYNELDNGGIDEYERGNYVFIIGNGTTNARSNALTVDWNGNTIQQGRAITEDMTPEEINDFVNNININNYLIAEEEEF